MWTQVKDCSLPILGDLFFIILVLWGSFFTLNLLLAVLEVNFSQGKEDDKVRPIQQSSICRNVVVVVIVAVLTATLALLPKQIPYSFQVICVRKKAWGQF